MDAQGAETVRWQRVEVTSPGLARPVAVVAARDIPYRPSANRFQTLSLYLPDAPDTASLVGFPVSSLPTQDDHSPQPEYLVHIHGGAWRDPQLTAASIVPTVAHAFADVSAFSPIVAIASINYTVSQFPTHPTLPYEAIRDNHSDPAREAKHPQHLSDVLHGLALLRSFGLTDGSYILLGHSCGACLAFQAILQPPAHYGLTDVPEAPCPAAVLGLNGLYDLPALVNGLDAAHEHLRDDYDTLLSNAFGANQDRWPAASPAHFDPAGVAQRVATGRVPRLVVLDQSANDQLVPMNQRERLEATLGQVDGMRVVAGYRCAGKHAAPWEQGFMIWDSILDTMELVGQR